MTLLEQLTQKLEQVPLSISSTRRSGANGLRNAEEVAAALMPIFDQAERAEQPNLIVAGDSVVFPPQGSVPSGLGIRGYTSDRPSVNPSSRPTLEEGVADEERVRLELRAAIARTQSAHVFHVADAALDAIRPFLRTKPIPAQPGEGEAFDPFALEVAIYTALDRAACPPAFMQIATKAARDWFSDPANTLTRQTAPAPSGDVSEADGKGTQ